MKGFDYEGNIPKFFFGVPINFVCRLWSSKTGRLYIMTGWVVLFIQVNHCCFSEA